MASAKDLFCGTVAGMTARVIEFPLDTIKVRVQGRPDLYTGYVDCTTKILRNEGVRGLFRGIAAPMAGAGLENAVAFSSYNAARSVYARIFQNGVDQPRATDPVTKVLFAGMVSGFGTAHVLTPVELVKCNMQVQNLLPKEQQLYTGVFDCAMKLYRQGGIRALFQGHTATLARETPGNAAWFFFYFQTRGLLTSPTDDPESPPLWKLMLSGGIGGVCYWTSFFPRRRRQNEDAD